MNISELLQSLKIDIDSLSMAERMIGGLSTALLSMGVVFVVLVLISFIIRIINPLPKESENIQNTTVENVKKEKVKVERVIDDTELVAAITAAIMASNNNKQIVVRRITRTNNTQSNWEKAANI